MEVLPFTCPSSGQDFKKMPPVDDRRPYSSPRGEVVLSCTVLDYLDPAIDKNGERARLVLDLVNEAWSEGNMSPYISARIFDSQLAKRHRKPSLWQRIFGSD
jgi:hypothetical protein